MTQEEIAKQQEIDRAWQQFEIERFGNYVRGGLDTIEGSSNGLGITGVVLGIILAVVLLHLVRSGIRRTFNYQVQMTNYQKYEDRFIIIISLAGAVILAVAFVGFTNS